jgi:hypothetical protein
MSVKLAVVSLVGSVLLSACYYPYPNYAYYRPTPIVPGSATNIETQVPNNGPGQAGAPMDASSAAAYASQNARSSAAGPGYYQVPQQAQPYDPNQPDGGYPPPYAVAPPVYPYPAYYGYPAYPYPAYYGYPGYYGPSVSLGIGFGFGGHGGFHGRR